MYKKCEVGRLHTFVHNVYILVEWCTDHSPKADARTPFAIFPPLFLSHAFLSTLTYLRRGKPHQSYSVNQLRSQTLSPWLSQDTTVGTSHKAQMIGTTRLLYTLRPLVHSASYRPGRATTNLIMNLGVSHSHEASIGSIDSLDHWFPMYLSRLGSGLEAFSHNP